MPYTRLTALQNAVRRHCPEKVTHTAFDFLTLYRTDTVTDPVLVVYEPRIYVVVQGEKVLYLHDQPFTYDESQYLISTLDLPVSGRITRATKAAPYLALCISFSPLEIAALIQDSAPSDVTARAGGTLPRRNAAPSPAMGVSAITGELVDTLYRLLSLLDREDGQAFLARLCKQELLYYFLQGRQGHVLRDIAHGQSDLSRINRAILHLRHHFREHFEIGALVDVAGMGQSSFYKRFGELTGMTPVQYRTKLRLQEARRLMLHEGMKAADAGFSVGYESPSQFSRDYRRIFDRPPHLDLKHIRAMGIAAYKQRNEDVWS